MSFGKFPFGWDTPNKRSRPFCDRTAMHPKHLGKKEARYDFAVHVVVEKLLPNISAVEVTWKQTGKKHGVQVEPAS